MYKSVDLHRSDDDITTNNCKQYVKWRTDEIYATKVIQ